MTDIFNFTQDKLDILSKANSALKIDKSNHNRIVFIYSAPKVGSTSLVSSLRIFGIDKLDIIHIHDEMMLNTLANITNISVNEIIQYNKYLGKDVYVINIFRNPIERKISTFFEKIGSYHFNNSDSNVNNYDVNKVINRFNNVFEHIGNGDHFIDTYKINIPNSFDFVNKYLLVEEQGIKYISLRLKDSDCWQNILTNIFGFHIHIIKDYESSDKPIKDLYARFKNNYRVPSNFLIDITNNIYMKYYFSIDEIRDYYNYWSNKSISTFRGYTEQEYHLYQTITIENTHLDIIQIDHYFDEGCRCKACQIKRNQTAMKIIRGDKVTDKIIHINAKSELIEKRVKKATKINHVISKNPVKIRGKDFKILSM